MSPERTNQCAECGWSYPYRYLSPLHSSKGDTAEVCGVCALALSNRVLGVERPRFNGRMAEQLRQMAITWRVNHPDLAPPAKTPPPETPQP